MRITPPRPLGPGASCASPDLSEPFQASAACPFCPPALLAVTPSFPSGDFPSPRLACDSTLIFPNLSPYGRHSAVLTFSEAHHIPLDHFSPQLFGSAFRNIAAYLSLVQRIDPGAARVAITQNILPSSGGALFHPHMQINLDPEPMGYHDAVLRRSDRWAKHYPDSDLLCSWSTQEAASARHVLRKGNWHLLAAFAPAAAEEFHLICDTDDPTRWGTPSPDDWNDLAALASLTLSFWASRGHNSAHVVLFLSLTGEHPPLARLLLRATYSPWYRNDQSCYEVGCWEPARDVSPEELATALKQFTLRASAEEAR